MALVAVSDPRAALFRSGGRHHLVMGGRHHSVTTGDFISFWWAASPGISTLMGLGDLAIGLVYMFGLTKELAVSHRALLLARAR